MNLYEFEGKNLFAKHGIATPKGVVVRRGDDVSSKCRELSAQGGSASGGSIKDVVVKAQVLSGKRGKNNGIKFCSNAEEVMRACKELFAMNIRGQYVAAVLIEEKLQIAEEHYLSIVYDTNKKQPVMIYSTQGGMDIEDVPESEIEKMWLDVRQVSVTPSSVLPLVGGGNERDSERPSTQLAPSPIPPEAGPRLAAVVRGGTDLSAVVRPRRTKVEGGVEGIFQHLWNCFLQEDTRQVEINPLVKTVDGRWVAADAKIAIDDDAFFRHEDWKNLEPRTMMGRLPTEREIAAKKIDEGEAYYRGTAGKYIELDGDIALILNGGGASIANMDALAGVGLKAANYTEYSGNPPREKVYQLAKVVLSKPGLKGLWMCGVVANFTNVKETFMGIVDALDEIKPTYPIVVRRDGTESTEGFALLEGCAKRNNLKIKMFKKETGMSETAKVLAEMVR